MVLNVHRNHKAYYGRGEGWKGVWRWGKREIIYLSLHCHHQNDFCIKMGSDENHCNISLIVRDKVTNKTVSTDHNFCREWTAEADSNSGPSAYQPDALPLDQTGSPKTGPLDWPEHEACRRRLIQYSTNRSRVGRSRRENRLSKRPV